MYFDLQLACNELTAWPLAGSGASGDAVSAQDILVRLSHIRATLNMFTAGSGLLTGLPVLLLFCLWLQVHAGLLMRRMCAAS